MNTVSKIKTIDGIIETIKEVKYLIEPIAAEAANANDPIKASLISCLINSFESWTQNSYEAWEKAGRSEHF